MTRTSALLITSVVAAALALSACGSDSSKASSGSSGGSATIASKLIFGGPPEFQTRTDGLPGLEKHYGVVFQSFQQTDVGGPVTVTKLKNGQIDAADLFTTDPSIEANGFVALTDPKSNFAAQNVLPLINKSKVTPGVSSTLNAISAKLDTAGLTDLVTKVQNDKQDPDATALAWLKAKGLDTPGTAAAGLSIKVGSANFPENVVLAQIYAEALKAQGATVTTTLNIGSREKYLPALKDGSIDLLPEYNGALLQYLDKNATATTPQEVYKALPAALPGTLTVLEQSQAQDSDAVVVTKATAQKYGLTSIADLAKPAS